MRRRYGRDGCGRIGGVVDQSFKIGQVRAAAPADGEPERGAADGACAGHVGDGPGSRGALPDVGGLGFSSAYR